MANRADPRRLILKLEGIPATTRGTTLPSNWDGAKQGASATARRRLLRKGSRSETPEMQASALPATRSTMNETTRLTRGAPKRCGSYRRAHPKAHLANQWPRRQIGGGPIRGIPGADIVRDHQGRFNQPMANAVAIQVPFNVSG